MRSGIPTFAGLFLTLMLGTGCFNKDPVWVTIPSSSGPPASAANSTLVASVSTLVADGVSVAKITVTLKSAAALPASGKSVQLTSSRGSVDVISPSTGVSDGSGSVTFSVRSTQIGSAVFTANDVTDAVLLSSRMNLVFVVSVSIESNAAFYDFGTHGVGMVANHSFTVTNIGFSTVTGISVSGVSAPFTYRYGSYPGWGGNCTNLLAPGASCTLVISYTAVAGTQVASLSLNYNSPSAQSSSQSMMGTGTTLAFLSITDNPPSYYSDYNIPSDGAVFSYGSIGLNTPSDHTFSITNNGGIASAALADGSGFGAPYSYKGGTFPGAGGDCVSGGGIAVGATCTVVVTFNAAAAATTASTLILSYSGGSATRPLSGTGTAGPAITIYDIQNNNSGPGIDLGASFDFGTYGVSTSNQQMLYVWNGGGATATGLTSTLSGIFTFSGGSYPGGTPGTQPANGHSQTSYCGSTLGANSACMVAVVFSPSSVGASTATLNLTSSGGTASRPLRGVGTASALLTVSPANNNGGPSSFYDFGFTDITAPGNGTFMVTNQGGSTATGIVDSSSFPAPYLYASGSVYPGGSGSTTINGTSYNFCGTTLAVGSSCVVSINYSPTVPGSVDAAILSLTYNDGSGATPAATLALQGTGTNLAVISISDQSPNNHGGGGGGGTPSSDYGYVSATNTSSQFFFLTNSSSTRSTTITSVALTAPFAYSNGGVFPGGVAGAVIMANGYNTKYCPASGGTLVASTTCVIEVDYVAAGNTIQGTSLTVTLGTATSASVIINLTATSTTAAIIDIADSTMGGGGGNQGAFDYGTWGTSVPYVFLVRNSAAAAAPAANLSDGLTLGSGFSYTSGSFPGATAGTAAPAPNAAYNYCGATLSGGASPNYCAISVTFSPSGTSVSNSTLTVNLTAAVETSATRSLVATSTTRAFLLVSEYPSSFPCGGSSCNNSANFPSTVHAMTSAPNTFYVTNTGAQATLSTSDGGINNSPIFNYTGGTFPGTGGTCSNVVPLLSGNSCTVILDFSPTGITNYSGALNINASDAGGAVPTGTRSLAGQGT